MTHDLDDPLSKFSLVQVNLDIKAKSLLRLGEPKGGAGASRSGADNCNPWNFEKELERADEAWQQRQGVKKTHWAAEPKLGSRVCSEVRPDPEPDLSPPSGRAWVGVVCRGSPMIHRARRKRRLPRLGYIQDYKADDDRGARFCTSNIESQTWSGNPEPGILRTATMGHGYAGEIIKQLNSGSIT
ncbi:hypothetical protein DFH09DRAFT_1079795 [Mycena vulgaris]|nr:hypothetical protein DFH09DRAFT_1079795 [Mycena vulgaris]